MATATKGRKAADPTGQVTALEDERRGIALKRDALGQELVRARHALDVESTGGELSIRARRAAALSLEARGRPHEDITAIDADERHAQTVMATVPALVAGLDDALREIRDEIANVRSEHIEHYVREAHAASLAAVDAADTAAKALADVDVKGKAAEAAHAIVRSARVRRGWSPGPPMPLSDVASRLRGQLVGRFAQMPPWPGGRRPRDEQALSAGWRDIDWP